MKYTSKMPDTDKVLSKKLQADGWKKIKEPRNMYLSTILSLPIAVILGVITLMYIYWLNPSMFSFLNDRKFEFSLTINIFTILYIIAILIYMLIHEFLHLVFIPNFIKSNKTFWGVNCGFGFVATTEKIKKSRFVIISIMPYLVLSFILPFVLNLIGVLNGFWVFLFVLNAIGACIDILNLLIVIFQVPNGAYIVNNGFETYYKKEN